METPEEKIALDDISFDDILDGGLATAPPAEPKEKEPETETVDEVENPAADELDADAEELASDQEEEEVEEEEEDEEEYEEDDQEEETEDDEVSEEAPTVVAEILEKLGYEGEYEDTTEGLTQMTEDVSKAMAEEQMQQLFEKFPLVKNHLEYVLNGGQSQDFMQAYDPNLDYSKISLQEEDARSQKAILSDYFVTKGHDKNFINELITDYEETGKLYQKAEAARIALTKVQGQQRAQMLEQQKQQRAQAAKDQEEFWNGVSQTIDEADELAGINIPKREKAKFFDYVSRPVAQDGSTQRDLDHNESELEVRLAIDYLMFKGFDLKNIINKKARSQNARTLRDKISSNEERVKSARKAGRRKSKSVDLEDLDLNF